MITEDYVSFETAKLLKEKGFNEVCEMFYCKPHEGYLKNCKRDEWWNSDLREDMTCTCPSIQMAMKWLRKEHNIQIVVSPYNTLDKTWSYHTFRNFEALTQHFYAFETYEEAAEAAIKYCLENLI